MNYLKLLADGIRSVVELPFKALRYLVKFQQRKAIAEQAVSIAGGELRDVEQISGAKRFLLGVGLVLLYVLAVVAVIAVLVGLWYLNGYLDLPRQLGGPFPSLRAYWLPLLLVLFVAALLAGRWAWRLVGPLGEPAGYPDIREAFAEARAALAEAGLPLTDLPLYLVVGRPAAGVGSLFTASRLTFTVRGVPGRGDAPVQVYANTKGIYVACPGASLLGRLSAALAEGDGAADPPAATARTVFEEVPTDDGIKATADLALPTQGELLLPDDPSPRPAALLAPARPRRVPPLVQDRKEVETAAARLRYLAKLIAFHREPYCGANGVVLLVPLAAAESAGVADQAAGAVETDLAAVRDGLGVDCPVAVVGCDLEAVPGAGEFLRLVPDDRRDRLLGLPFPAAADVSPDRLPAAVADAVRWATGAIERMVVRGIELGEGGESLRVNAERYRFLAAVRAGQGRLANVFRRAAGATDGRPARFVGAYLAATGADPARDQAFVPGVFRLLSDNQNAVAWTPAARAADAAYRRWAMFGYLAIGAFMAGVGYLCYRQWA
jgi:hypothetical protein